MTISRRGAILLFEFVFLAFCVLAMAWLYDHWFIPGSHGPVRWVGMDFTPYWVGTRAMVAGQSPYSLATTSDIQSLLLGGVPAVGEDPMLYVYPAWIFLLVLPFSMLPVKWAAAIWTGALLLGTLHLLGALALRWGGRQPLCSGLWALLLVIGSLPFITIAVTKGQFSLLSLGALFLALRLVDRQSGNMPSSKSTLSSTSSLFIGILLAIAILKPTMSVPAVAGFLIWALLQKRWLILSGFGGCLALLFLISWLAVGYWVPDYLFVLRTNGGAPVLWSLASLGGVWKIIYAIPFIGILFLAWSGLYNNKRKSEWFSAMLLAGLAFFPIRWIYDLLLGILVPADVFHVKGWLAISMVLALLAPWGLAFLPESTRWDALVIGLPLAWSLVWLLHRFLVYNSKTAMDTQPV